MSPTLDRRLTIALLLLLPVLCAMTGNTFYKSMLVFGIISSIAAIGLCLMLGLAGQISLGQAAFFGFGAYVTANLSGKLGIEPLLAILIGAATSMLVGWSISRPLSRLHDHYLAMATLAFGTMTYIAFANARALTGGLDPGMSVAKFTILGREFASMNELFVLAWLGLAGSVVLANNISRNRIGRSLRALKMSPAGAASVGIDVVRAKAFVFAVGALLTGFAGGIYAFAARSFNASVFGIGYSIELLMMVVIGSLNRVSGAIAGAFIISTLPMLFERFEDYRTLVFGITMVVIMKFMPAGLVDGLFGIGTRIVSGKGR